VEPAGRRASEDFMTDLLDKARAPREGETLDIPTLEAYLKEAIPGLDGALEVQQFPSGFSNLTYLIRVGTRDMVLRRPPFGSKVKSAHDMGREHRVLSALHPVYPQAPKPLAYCEDPAVMGVPFYVMERIQGVILRGKKPAGFECDPATVRRACEALVENMATLHRLDYAAAGLAELHKEGSYVERQVGGWTKRYEASKTDDIASMEQAAAWLLAHCPADSATTLIHNDYKFDNVVLDPNDLTRIIGVLDWEMCTIGDPLMDLATSMAYWNEPGDPNFGVVQCFLTMEPGAMTRREVIDHYASITGRDIGDFTFYYVYGLFKLAVIVQQIYYRYKQGLTKDERFAPLIFMVGALGQKAAETLETGEI
jgi:aminoglycoside phosphotransferase (APT) family kinase protein